jgi:hypothetical protein
MVKNQKTTDHNLSWEQFEKVVLSCAALREMSLAETSRTATLRELYPGALGKPEILSRTFEISENVELDHPTHRTAGEILYHKQLTPDSHDGSTKSDYMYLNTKGAVFDGMYDRYMIISNSKRELYRIILQKKYYMMGKVSLETIVEEADKVAKSLRGTDFEGRYTLVFVVTELQVNLEKHPDKIPSECIILHGSALQEFFGEALAYRMLGLGEGSIVSVNAAPKNLS